MTLGERILLKRKELGLSQEDLGNKLEVSRQTVYKWESNQAVPELNKLISMAEILGVKVGWLIAEETDTAPSETEKEQSDEEEAYNKAAERLIQIIEANEKKKEAPFRQAFIGPLIALLVFTSIFGITKMISLERKYQELNRSIDRNNNYVQQEIDGITTSVSAMLNNYNSITLNSDVKIAGVDFSKNTITFETSAAPKTYTAGMRAVFHVTLGDAVYDFEGIENSGKVFAAKAEVPLTNDTATISVEFVNGTTSEISNITSYYELLESTFPFYDIDYPFEKWMKPDYSGFEQEYFEVMEMHDYYDYKEYYGLSYQKPKIVSMEAFLTEDGKRIADYVYDPEYSEKQNGMRHPESSYTQGVPEPYWYYFRRPSRVELTKGKTYEEHFIATDEYGRQIEVTGDENGRVTDIHIDE